MKTLLFFTDTETTGFSREKDQILSFSLVMCEKDETLLETELKVKIKRNVLPNPKALLINNINPFVEAHTKDAMTEYEGAHKLAEIILEYRRQGYRVVLIAYNAEFDVEMYQEMFKRSGINFDAIFTNVFDPLIVAKQMVADKSLKTKLVNTGYGKSYNSAKLEDVYNALGYSSVGIQAHNALEDTKMLKTATFKLYYLMTGKSLDEASVDLSTFTPGELKTIVYNEGMELVQKTIKVLKVPEGTAETMLKHSILALDYDRVKEKGEKLKSNLIQISHTNIFDELDVNYGEMQKLENFYLENQEAIDELVKNTEIDQDKVFATHEELYFGKIEKLAEKMLKDPKAPLTPEEQELADRAEEYAYARFNDGWTVKNLGDNYQNEIKSLPITDEVSIELNPLGFFQVNNLGKIELVTEKKTELLDMLKNQGLLEAGTPQYKEANQFLITIKKFKNIKHPEGLIKEFNEKKGEVFNGSNSHHKETMKSLMKHYQTVNREPFKELSLPDFKLNLNVFKRPAGK